MYGSPEEEELAKLKEELESNNKAIEAYNNKLKKIPEVRAKYTELSKTEGVTIDLLDSAGERKFMNVKKESQASEFLGDKNVYHLARVKMPTSPDGKPRVTRRRRGRTDAFRGFSFQDLRGGLGNAQRTARSSLQGS